MKRINWTARCKSGYTFNGRTCNQSTGRGVLMCDGCKSAFVIAEERSIRLRAALMSFAVIGIGAALSLVGFAMGSN